MQAIANYSSSEESNAEEETPQNKRVRKIPHIFGNWATFVYINVYSPELDFACNSYLKRCNLTKLDKLHISLSKTGFMKVFQIQKFINSLSTVFEYTRAFNIGFLKVSGYSDDENSQHFLALDVCEGVDHIKSLMQKIDPIMESFCLDKYCKDAKFHASFAYSRTKIKPSTLRKLNDILQPAMHIRVEQVECQVGNRNFSWNFR